MAEELQHLPKINATDSNTGDLKNHRQLINNIIIILAKMFIFNLQSVETMRIERFRTFVKHHSTEEKYMAARNQYGMFFRDPVDGRG